MKLVMKRVGLLYLSLIMVLMGKSVIVYAQTYLITGDHYTVEDPKVLKSAVPKLVHPGTKATDCKDPSLSPPCWKEEHPRDEKKFKRVKFEDLQTGEKRVGWIPIEDLRVVSKTTIVFPISESHPVIQPKAKKEELAAPEVKDPPPSETSPTSQVAPPLCNIVCEVEDKFKSAVKSITGSASSSGNFHLNCSDVSKFSHSSLVSFQPVSTKVKDYYELSDGSYAARNVVLTKGPQPANLCAVTVPADCPDPDKEPASQFKLAQSFNTRELTEKVVSCKTPYVIACQKEGGFDTICAPRFGTKKGKPVRLPPTPACTKLKEGCWDSVDKKPVCQWEKTKLGKASQYCMAATEQFYIACDKTAQRGNTPELQEEVSKEISNAVNEYKKTGGKRSGSSLSASLARCLVQREDHDLQTYRMNATQCGSGESTAVGLFQMTETLMSELKRQNILDNTCKNFKNLLSDESDACANITVKDLHDKMATNRELQIAIGIEGLDYYLQINGDNVRSTLKAYLGAGKTSQYAADIMSCMKSGKGSK
jgi:hypothetical protein